MTAAGAHRYTASNYHDLVDMPFFVGQFDLDSAQISGTWVRFATYPSGSVTGGARNCAWISGSFEVSEFTLDANGLPTSLRVTFEQHQVALIGGQSFKNRTLAQSILAN